MHPDKKQISEKTVKTKRKKHYKYNIRPRFFLVLCIVVAIVFFLGVWLVGLVNRSLIKTVDAAKGEIEYSATIPVTVARNGIIIKAPASGVVRPLAADGEKVGKGDPLFEIVDAQIDKDFETKAQSNINAKKKLDIEWKVSKDAFDSQIETINSDSRERIEAIAELDNDQSTKKKKLQGELDNLFIEGQKITAARDKAEAVYKTESARLAKEKLTIETARMSKVTTYRAPFAGLLTYSIGDSKIPWNDNYLMALDPEAVEKFADVQALNGKKEVTKDQPVAQIIDVTKVKMVGIFDDKQMKTLLGRQTYEIFFPEAGKDPVKVLVLGAGKNSDGKNVMVFSSSQWLDYFAKRIKMQGKVVFGRYKGMIVPLECLVRKDGEDGVIIKSDSDFVFKQASVLGDNGTQAAIIGIDPGTAVVVNPGRVKGF